MEIFIIVVIIYLFVYLFTVDKKFLAIAKNNSYRQKKLNEVNQKWENHISA